MAERRDLPDLTETNTTNTTNLPFHSDEFGALFKPEELAEFHERLRNGEVLNTNYMGGCHTYLVDIKKPNVMIETL